jgi:hypothetical protein
MTVETRPLAEVTRRAIEVLSRELGSSDALRFINQFTTGYGDYTSERDGLYGGATLDQIISDVKRTTSVEASDPAVSEIAKRRPGGPLS